MVRLVGGSGTFAIQWLGGSQGARGIHIPYIFPIRWGAKELLRVSQPSNSLLFSISFMGCHPKPN